MQIFRAYYYRRFLLSKNLCRLFIHSPIFSLHKWNERDQCGYHWSVPSPQVQIRLSMHRCLSIKYICIFMKFESFIVHTEREIRIVQSRATATPACTDQQNDSCNDKPSNTNTLIDHASCHYWINTTPEWVSSGAILSRSSGLMDTGRGRRDLNTDIKISENVCKGM